MSYRILCHWSARLVNKVIMLIKLLVMWNWVDAVVVCWKQEHVCGEFCDQCLPGFYNLRADNPAGCDPCFCFEITDQCTGSTWGRDTVPHSVSTVSWFCVITVKFSNYLTGIFTRYFNIRHLAIWVLHIKYFESYALFERKQIFSPKGQMDDL